MKKVLVVLALLGLAAAAVVVAAGRDARLAALLTRAAGGLGPTLGLPPPLAAETGAAPAWRTVAVERGAIESAVLATGTLQPVQSIQVSSQVSGQIVAIVADFNAKVTAGEVIARLDPTTFQGRLAQAEADLAVAQATVVTRRAALERAKSELVRFEEASRDADRAFERTRTLARGAVSERAVEQAEATALQARAQVASARSEIAMAEAEVRVAEANVEQRRALVRIARTDLDRTTIKSPIDGVVIDRQIELGQTVAASLQAPTLFVIAAALEEMQLEASIDEADVGRVREGQPVRFTVDAYPGRVFEGRVAQVRRAAKAVQNVVTYTAVVSADNASGALFPGMTANVRLIVEQREDALKVPQAALRFRPVDAGDGATPAAPARKRARPVNPSADEGRRARLHVVRADGRLEPIEVTVGIAAESVVEVAGDGLAEGDQVAVARIETGSRRGRAPLGF